MEDEIIKLDHEIICLRGDAKYERRGKNLYCLNYAEPGMSGSSLGKLMPDHLAIKILKQYESEQTFGEIKKNQVKKVKIKTEIKQKQKRQSRKNNSSSDAIRIPLSLLK